MSFPCVFCNAPTIAPWETVEIEGLQKLRKLELTSRKGRKSGKSPRRSINSLKIKFFTIINSIFDVPAAKINAFISSYDFSKHSPFCLSCHKKANSLSKLGQEKSSLEKSILELQKGLHQKLKKLKNVMNNVDSTLSSLGDFVVDSIEEDEKVDCDDVVNENEAKKKHRKLLDSLRKSMKIRLEREESISSTSKKKASDRSDEPWTVRKMKETVKNYPKGFVVGKNSNSKNIKKKVNNSVAFPKSKAVSSKIEDTIKTDIEYEDVEVKLEYDEMPEFDPADYEPSVDDMNDMNLRNFLVNNDEIEDKYRPQSTEEEGAGGIRRSLRKRKITEKEDNNNSGSSEEDFLEEESSNSGSENGNESDWIEEFASKELEVTYKKTKKMKRLLELEPGLLGSEALVPLAKEATAQRDTLAKFMEESLRALGDFDSMEEIEGRFRGVYRGIQVDTINSAEEGKCLECESCRHFVKIKGHATPRDILLASKQIRCHINEKHFGGYICTNAACSIGKEEPRVYKSLDKYVDHLRRHNKKNCDICGKPVTVEGYIRHIWTHKSEEDKQQAIESGEIPPRPQKVNKTRNFLCISCGAAFPTEKTLKQHEGIHLNKKERDRQRIPCDKCGKLLLPVSIASHEKYAHQKKETLRTFACPACPKTFFNNSVLKSHIKKTHSDAEKKFKCTICSKAFFMQRLLNIHSQTHLDRSQRELLECDQCSAKFTSLKNLKRHVEVLHAPNRPQTTTNKRNRKQKSHQQNKDSSSSEEENETYFPHYENFNSAVPGPSSSNQMNSNFGLSAVPTFHLSNTYSNNDHQFHPFYTQ